MLRVSVMALAIFAAVPAMSGSPVNEIQKERLDEAGRERMLVQRVVKSSCLVMSGVNVDHYAGEAKKIAHEFEDNLEALITGDPARNWPAEQNPVVREAMQTAVDEWKNVGPPALQVAYGDLNNVVVKQITNNTDDAVAAMNKAVLALQNSQSVGSLTPAQAATLNVAGRQRMLSQRIAKDFCFVKNDISKAKSTENLRSTVLLFGETLEGLKTGTDEWSAPPNASVELALGQVEDVWSKLLPILIAANNGTEMSHDDLKNVADLSEELLDASKRLVKTYLTAFS